MKSAKSEGVETKYQSNSPGVYWIKISNANKLRDKALKAKDEETNKKVEWFEKWKLYTFAYPHTIKCDKCNKDTGIHFQKKTEILCRKCLIDKAFKGER